MCINIILIPVYTSLGALYSIVKKNVKIKGERPGEIFKSKKENKIYILQ